MLRKTSGLLRKRGGDLTDELARAPGGFGLGLVPARLRPDSTISTVCGFCSTGCSLDVHMSEQRAVNLSPSAGYPVNLGMACPKGWEALTPLGAPDRATAPLLRNARRHMEAVSWDTAIDHFVGRVRTLQARYGAESMAFLGTGQMPTEELALLGALAKFGMGMVHGDGNTRQCMATAVVAYKESFGFDAPPYTYADFEASDVIVLIGSNLCIAHPILWQRICRNPHDPKIVVIDPRRTETAMAATVHYPLAPKSDLHLLYGVARELIARGLVDRDYVEAHTSGFDEFAAYVDPFTAEAVGERTGLGAAAIRQLADTIGSGERVSLWWTMGVNQSHEGVRTAQAIINLALMTGNIGRPGTGANSITGQCNAMGSRLFSNTSSLLGGRAFTEQADRERVAELLAIEPERVPSTAGFAYDQIVEGINRGQIKGLWIVATNTAHSWISHGELPELLSKLEFLVVQDMYATTETAQLADLLLPAAGWGEKEGTFINSERRIGRVRRVATPPGDALSDFEIFLKVARAWGCGRMFDQWTTPEATFGILQELSRGQPCDFSGIVGYAMLDELGGVQWPFAQEHRPEPGSAGGAERRLFEDGRYFHPNGRARFIFGEPRPVAEPTSSQFPLVLLTGRGSSAQWHTQTRTGKSPLLRSLYPQRVYVEISPVDAEDLSIATGDEVVVESARGSLRALALVTSTVSAGQVFMPMHYPQVNRLTRASFDPYSRQPSYKHAAVRVRRPAHWES